MTGYERHRRKWSQCTRCLLKDCRHRVVLVRGTSLPCKVLFCGEAPGISEDAIGLPFVGPAGKLMDRIIERSCRRLEQGDGKEVWMTVSYALTNLVACLPLEPDGQDKRPEPPEEVILACRPRLLEIVDLAQPKLVVCVGRLAAKWLPEEVRNSYRVIEVIHPAAILRMDLEFQKQMAIRRCIVAITEAVESP